MVPAPIELKRGRGSSTTDRKICSTNRGAVTHIRSPLARARGRRHDDQQESRTSNLFADAHAGASYGVARDSNPNQQLSSGVSAFDTFAAVSRAREARRFPGALRRSDLLEPPGRRCGCWRRRHLRFSELLTGRFWFGADDGAQAVAADVGFAGSGRRRWCRRRSS